MPATDPASLLAVCGSDESYARNRDALQLVIIGLLRIIAKSVNPVAATDAATILAASGQDASYARNGNMLALIEIGLLRIIAAPGGATGGLGGVTAGNYSGAAPTFTPASGSAIAIDTSTTPVKLWYYYSGGWH